MSTSSSQLTYELSLRALDAQRDRLDNLRGRAATLLSAAGIVTSFLGVEALKDTKIVDGQALADRAFNGPEIVGLAAFVLLGIACIYIVLPKSDSWQFEVSAEALTAEYPSGADVDSMQVDLALVFESAHGQNEAKLGRFFWAFRLATVFLFVEVLAWIAELA